MKCIKAHCGNCDHICVKSPVFKPTQEERIEILLTDEFIISKKDFSTSGVIEMTSEEIIDFISGLEDLSL